MDFFETIAEGLNEIRTYISKADKGFSFKRDFKSLCYNAKEKYKNYSKKVQSANILDKLYFVFCDFFDKKMNRLDSLPFSIPEKEYESDKKREELEAIFNASSLIEVSFSALYKCGLIKSELKEKAEFKKMTEQAKNDFLTDFRNNGFKFGKKMILDHFAKFVQI